MHRTFQFRLRPNAAQCAFLEMVLADNCETYNACLQERIEAWKLQRKSITYHDQTAQLTQLRTDKSFRISAADIQRDPLRRVDRAFRAFFRRFRDGERPGFPRYRSVRRYDSFSFGNSPVIRPRSIKIPTMGDIRARGGRPIVGTPKYCTVKRAGKHWTASVVCDIGEAPQRITPVSSSVGVDVGLSVLVTLSDGTTFANPRWTRKHETRIAAASRRLARKQRRSRNRIRMREALRRAYQRAADARSNYIHHVSKWLIENYDLIAHEDLKISNMARSAKGTIEAPGKNVKQKAGLNRSIMDAAWGQLIWQLTYKAEKAGKWVVPVNPRNTSQKCSGCGQIVLKKLSQRTHSCSCGLELGRDHNAGLNILALGMSAAGVRPSEHIGTSVTGESV